jgi:hypothetical protein
VNECIFSSFELEKFTTRLTGGRYKSAGRAAHRERAVKGNAARVAKRAPISQSKVPTASGGGASVDAATFEAVLAAANVGIRALVKVNGLLLSAYRVPAQGNGRVGCGTPHLRLGEKDVIRLSGLPVLLANMARSATDPEGSVGGV